jgi:hypothetical protein
MANIEPAAQRPLRLRPGLHGCRSVAVGQHGATVTLAHDSAVRAELQRATSSRQALDVEVEDGRSVLRGTVVVASGSAGGSPRVSGSGSGGGSAGESHNIDEWTYELRPSRLP